MADIKDLREKMAKLATEARAKLSEITDETPEERAGEIERVRRHDGRPRQDGGTR